jgi:hypothetical protein
MSLSFFQLKPDEAILFQTSPDRKWYAVAWKVVVGLVAISFFTFLVYVLFIAPTQGFLENYLPTQIALAVSQFLCLGLVPLLITLWVVDDVARIFTSELILTTRRIWVKGSPYSWSKPEETPLDNIRTMTFRKDAVFIRLASKRKVQVHMFSEGKQLVEAFTRFTGKENPTDQ